MKTFEEACALFTAPKGTTMEHALSRHHPPAEEHQAHIESKYRELLHEVANSRRANTLFFTLLECVGRTPTEPNLVECFYTAFTYGLMVGIEMEKTEQTL